MVGTKRKQPGKVAKPPSDFKRLKAKVGSKAGKPLNETDTSFKKASLFVAGQTRGTPSAGSILSQKGKSLLDLSLQASHPAALARQSAIKGLLNILGEFGPDQLRAHLHVFLQVASIGLVDEDPNVRKVAYSLLEQILAKYDEPTLAPFLQLIVAYTCSGLHSLDRDMRVDGAMAAEIACSFFPSTMCLEHARSILPPFVGLLAEHRGKSLPVVLKALVKVLTIASSNHEKSFHPETGSPGKSADFIYRTGVRSRNAFIYCRRRPVQGAQQFSALNDVFSSFSGSQLTTSLPDEAVDEKKLRTGKPSFSSVLIGILKNLCDVIVELIDGDDGPNQEKEKSFTARAATTAVQAIYLATRAYIAESGGSKMDHDERTINILFDLFPLNCGLNGYGSEGQAQENDQCNALITKTLLLFDIHVESREQSKLRMNTLVSYWIASLEKEQRSSCHMDMIAELLTVFSSNPKRFTSTRKRILTEICGAFLLEPTREVARSVVGRKAVVMLAKACAGEAKLDSEERDEKVVADTLMYLPTYLHMWAADFQDESLVVLDSIYRIVCVMRKTENSIDDEVMRERMSLLFQKLNGKASTFEMLGGRLRCVILGIIRTLEKPSRTIVKALSALCAMEGAREFDGGIFDVIYSLRKSISLVDYLGFVIGSIGVPRLTPAQAENLSSNEAFLTVLAGVDYRVSRSARAAVECGSQKSLKMLEPQLLSWMQLPEDGDSSSRAFVLRCRVSLCFISMLLVDLAQSGISVANEPTGQRLLEGCATACGHVIGFLAGSDTMASQLEDRFLAPIGVLATIDSLVKRHVCDVVPLRLARDGTDPRVLEVMDKLDCLDKPNMKN